MTGQVTQVRSLVDRRITATVRAFIAARELRPEDVAAALGISRATLYYKLKGKSPWTATEVAALADLFGITVSDLYSGLSGTFIQSTGTWAEQDGTWADARPTPEGPVSTRWSLYVVPDPDDPGLAAAA